MSSKQKLESKIKGFPLTHPFPYHCFMRSLFLWVPVFDFYANVPGERSLAGSTLYLFDFKLERLWAQPSTRRDRSIKLLWLPSERQYVIYMGQWGCSKTRWRSFWFPFEATKTGAPSIFTDPISPSMASPCLSGQRGCPTARPRTSNSPRPWTPSRSTG